MDENPYKIFIVDDFALFRDGLKYMIEEIPGIRVSGEAANGKQFLESLDCEKPDLVLMDISMPVLNGIEATEKAIEKYPDLKIIALSMYGEPDYFYKMINAGATGFVLKQAGKNELEQAISKVSQGDCYFSPALLSDVVTRLNNLSASKPVKAPGMLNDRETEIIRLACKGLSNAEIAEKLFLSSKTVEGYKTRLFKKTGSKNIAGLIMFAIRNGIYSLPVHQPRKIKE